MALYRFATSSPILLCVEVEASNRASALAKANELLADGLHLNRLHLAWTLPHPAALRAFVDLDPTFRFTITDLQLEPR